MEQMFGAAQNNQTDILLIAALGPLCFVDTEKKKHLVMEFLLYLIKIHEPLCLK